jgi:hypothetical protein
VEKPKHAKIVSKRTFWFVTAAMTIVFTLAELPLLRLVSSKLLPATPEFSPLNPVLLMPSFLVSFFAVDAIFRSLGLSRSGSSVETWERDFAKRDGLVAGDAIVNYRDPRSEVRTNFALALFFCLFGIGVSSAGAIAGAHPALLVPSFALGFWMGGCAIQIGLAWDGCFVRADPEGVFGYPARFAIRRKSLLWPRIATCDIVTRRDPFGTPYLIAPVFKDESGAKLMSLSLHGVPMEYQLRLANYIKAKLPKATVDFALV